jgi:polysaccharide biosynthesis/export protein
MNRYLVVFIIGLIFMTKMDVVMGQTTSTPIDEDQYFQKSQEQIQTQYQQQSLQNLQNLKIAIMDGPIDPKEYIVGPGDIYSVNVWLSPPLSFQLPITPEGSIIIPTVGVVPVAGLNLEEAKAKVIAAIRKKYITGDISFTLLTPRVLAVTVKGVVKNEGTVYVQASDRIDAAVAAANALDKNLPASELLNAIPKYNFSGNFIVKPDTVGSDRRIIVRHRDGTKSIADLERYFIQRDPRFNPLLRDGDIIIVPKRNLTEDFVGVYGAVNREGTYEFVPGDSLVSMLKIARGLTELADSQDVEITRSDETGNSSRTFTVNLASIVARETTDVPLMQGDRIVVKEKQEILRDYKVFIEGEVQYPGYYPITRDSTTLSQVIRQAGGFRDDASLEASHVYRKMKTYKSPRWTEMENAQGITSQEDTSYFINESALQQYGQLVVTDFPDIFLKHDSTKDVIVRDGDHIVVPSQAKTVYVFGQVVHPGHLPYVKNQSYKYYLEQAGGMTDDAVGGDVKIIKAKNNQWLSPDETTIEEGDYIWVPKAPYRPFSYYLQIYSQVFGIIGTVATVAVLVIQANK